MRIHVIVTGFGQPRLEEKQRIARANHSRFAQSRHAITTTAFVYDDSAVEAGVFDEVIRGPGIVGQFVYALDPERQRILYDRIILILDDVELLWSDLDAFIDTCESLGPGVCQPSLSPDSMWSHQHMLMQGDDCPVVDTDFHRGRGFEYFMYYMRSEDFALYHALFNDSTRCTWGLDYLVPGVMPCYLLRDYKIKHWFKGGLSSLCDCFGELERVLAQPAAAGYATSR
jgi:hypothetical protein